jgi:signal transduction histidine kinase
MRVPTSATLGASRAAVVGVPSETRSAEQAVFASNPGMIGIRLQADECGAGEGYIRGMPAQRARSASIAVRKPVPLALGALLAASLASEALPTSSSDSMWVVRALAFTFATLVLALDVWRPVMPAWLVSLTVAVPAAWLNIVDVGSVSMLLVVGVVGWLAYSRPLRSALVGSAVALSAVVSYLPDRDTSGMLGVVVVSVATFVAASLVVRQQQLVEELKATQRELTLQAAAEERRRIAAEIHDVVAHSLAVTLLQLTGARMLVKRTGGDARALEALSEAERIGRESMTNLRRVVGLLREPGQGLGPVLPGPGGLNDLIEEFRRAGLPVTLTTTGDLDRLEPAVLLALYRICQEGLANVVKHAGRVPSHVTISVDEDVELVIANELSTRHQRPIADEGVTFGVPGMRERAALLGGRLTAEAVDGRWLVQARIPLGAALQPVVAASAGGR